MKAELLAIAVIFVGFALLEAARGGLWHKPGEVKGDVTVELVSGLTLLVFTQPAILALVAWLGATWLPAWAGALADLPFLAGFGLLLLLDDLPQYAYHRASHSIPALYKLHRPHHEAAYLSVRLVYRNALLYYLAMPSIWLSGLLIYLGLGTTYAVYIVAKLLVITAAHSAWAWDAPLYRIPALSPVMWVVERLISTPATHSAHHGRHAADGITYYKGNYGNFLFFWDVLFGTAKITRQRPPSYGVEDLPPTSTAEQLLWPLVRVQQTEPP